MKKKILILMLTVFVMGLFAVGGDDFTSAPQIQSLPYNDTGDTSTLTNVIGNTSADAFYLINSVMELTGLTIDLTGSSFDTYLRVYAGDMTTQLWADDDGGAGTTSMLSGLTFAPATDYYICVEGYSSNVGAYTMSIFADQIGSIVNASAPGAIANALPANGAVNQTTTTTLSWDFGVNTETYDLYFDTVNPPLAMVVDDAVAGVSGGYDPGALTETTTYYWQVISRNSATRFETANAVHSFSIAAGDVTNYPYNEQFDAWPPIGYTTSGTQAWAAYATAGTPAPAIFCNFWGWSTGNASFETLPFDATGITPALSFDWSHQYNASYPNDALEVSISTDAGANWTQIWYRTDTAFESNDGAGSTSPGTFVTEVVSLGAYANTTFSLKFDGISGYGPNLYLDNLNVVDNSVPPVVTTLVAPADAAIDQPTAGNLEWNAVNFADGYDLYLGTDNPPTDVLNGADQGTALTYAYSGLTGGVTYYWQVVPYNLNGDAAAAPVWSFTTSGNPPVVTTLVAPADAAIDQLTGGTLEWNAVPLADGYDLYFGSDNPPTDIVNGVDQGTALTYAYSGLTGGVTYYWQVVPYNVNGDAVAAPVWSFTTYGSAPDPVALIAPADGAIDQPGVITLSWNSDAWADGYYLNFGTDNPPTDVENMTDLGDVTSYDATNLDGLATYYWQVIPYNGNGNAVGAPVWSFTTWQTLVDVFPYSQSFDAATVPVGWVVDPIVSSDSWEVGSTELGGHGATAEHTGNGGNMMVIDDSSPDTVPAHLYTLNFDFTSLTAPVLSFWYWIGDSGNTSELHIDVITSTGTDASVGVFTDASGTLGWQQANVILSAYVGQTVSLDFRGMESTSFYGDISLDDVYIFDNSTPPAASTVVAPLDGATDQPTAGNLEWTAVPYADGYDLYLGTDNPPTDVVNGVDQGTALTYAYTALDPSMTYYWQVVPYNGNGSAVGAPVWSFDTAGLIPSPVTYIAPADMAVDQDFGVMLTWNASLIADGYYVNFGTDNPPTNVLNMYDNGAMTEASVSGLAGGTTYYWEAIPYTTHGNATGYATWSFTTYANAPAEIAMTAPADLATGVDSYTTFTWNTDVWADGYNLYISDDNVNFVQTDVGDVSGVTLTTPLNYESMYYWYVTGYNINGEGSAPLANYSFTTQSNPNYGGDGTLYGGYYFANSTVDGGGLGYQPTFNWIDISATGSTPTYTSADDGYMQVPIGFTFNYFGVDYTDIYIGTNGYCMFSNPTGSTGGTMSIPSAGTPNDVIALSGMDLHTANVPSVPYYGLDADGNFVYTVEMWNDYADSAEYMDMQLILYTDGRIKIQYQNYVNPNADTGTSSIPGDACIGIENVDGTIGHQYRNNGVGGPMLVDMALAYAPTAEGLAEPSNGLEAPTNLVLTYAMGLMNLSWDAVTGATLYNVYAGTTPDFVVEPASFLSTWPTNSAVMDPSLLPGNHYFVKVTADDVVVRTNSFEPVRRSYRTYGWVEYIEPTPVIEKAKK